ncbi:MAG: hypothetical protein HRT68_04205 [Flavobacteriaceae bacterium]|nr:hypothetical protein [Flavobacteriaceae bacterium]
MYSNSQGNSYTKYNYRFSSDYALTNQFLFYHDQEGELQKIGQGKITEAYLYGRRYSNLKIGSMFGFNRLHEILIESEDYILTQYFSTSHYLYLVDKKNEKFVYKKNESKTNARQIKNYLIRISLLILKTVSLF